MTTPKFKKLLATLEFHVGGDPVEWLDARRELTHYVKSLEQSLYWYIQEDEINECDPENQYWIEGKHKAMKILNIGDEHEQLV